MFCKVFLTYDLKLTSYNTNSSTLVEMLSRTTKSFPILFLYGYVYLQYNYRKDQFLTLLSMFKYTHILQISVTCPKCKSVILDENPKTTATLQCSKCKTNIDLFTKGRAEVDVSCLYLPTTVLGKAIKKCILFYIQHI